jgi:hypothetical protein
MKKFSKKSVLLFAAAMALCAFAMPSMASASSWGLVPSHHTLTSPDIGFINDSTVDGTITSMCTSSTFTTRVVSTANIEIDTASFNGCTLSAGAIIGQCTATAGPTNLPWTATAVSTSNVQIRGVNIDVFLENRPGGAACAGAGATIRITGTLAGGEWTGNGANQHEVLLTTGTGARAASGLVSHSALGAGLPITVTGTVRDAQQTLTVTN